MKRKFIYIVLIVLSWLSTRVMADNIYIDSEIFLYQRTWQDVAVYLEQDEEKYTGFQFDIKLPDGVTIIEDKCQLGEDLEGTMNFSIAPKGNGSFRIMAYSSTLYAIKGNKSAIVSLRIKGTGPFGFNSGLHLYNIVLSDGSGNAVKFKEQHYKIGLFNGLPEVSVYDFTRQYGDENNIEMFDFHYDGPNGTPEIHCDATVTSPVGTYPITASIGTINADTIVVHNGILTIEKAPLRLSVGNYWIDQGRAIPEFELNYHGFKNNETKDVLIVQPTITCNAYRNCAPGEYPIVISGAEAQNYEMIYNNGMLYVNEAPPINVTAYSYTRVYGDENPIFEYNAEIYPDGIPEITCEATAASPVGIYEIVIKQGTILNHNVNYVNGTLTITKAPLTITAKNYTITQGDALPTFEAEYSGFKNNETADVLINKPVLTTSVTSSSEPGTFDIVASGAEAQNYEISYVKGTLTINPGVYKLTYIVDGEVYKSCDVEYGTAITPETAPTKEGYIFSGWSEIPETMPAHDVTVTGTFSINKYKLTYLVDGIEYKSYDVEYGATITPEAEPTKEGYSFSGWSEIPETMPAHDVTVTGTFSINKYKLTYIVDGVEYKSYDVEYSATITPEVEPTKEGYTFSGWSEIPETMPAHDVTVTGTFSINKYKLTYLVDDIEYKSYNIEYGATITPETGPTKDGYTFSGWSEIPETMPAHDVTVTGSFTVNKYKLIYKVDGEVYKTYDVEYGAIITPETAPTKEGYIFSGWSEIPETMPAHDVTVTGSFSKGQYKLIYMVDGQTYKTISYDYGDIITPEPAPVRDGYTFSGWSEIPATMPAHDVTVIGTFAVNKYKLTYVVDGIEYKSYDIEFGAAITPETTPTKVGYTFSGWSEIPATMPAHDVTVTGTFSINKYKLTYIVDGVEYKSYDIEFGATITPEAEPTKEGYIFSGWSEIPETMPAHDVTVEGSFTVNKYKLTYIVDGVEYKSYDVEYGATITPEIEPTKEGYSFSGWSEIPATMPAHDVTVTGTFSINKYKLTYIVDGEVYKSYDIEYGATITPEAEPTKEGYIFSGWSEIPETMPAHDVTVEGTFTLDTTGIVEISVSNPADVYILQGQKVRSQATTLKGLPSGIYIVNGRKIFVK